MSETRETLTTGSCRFCGRRTHTLAVEPVTGRTMCVSVPRDDYTAHGTVAYTTPHGQRACVRAVAGDPRAVRDGYLAPWSYVAAAGWPLEEEDVPAEARAKAREIASAVTRVSA